MIQLKEATVTLTESLEKKLYLTFCVGERPGFMPQTLWTEATPSEVQELADLLIKAKALLDKVEVKP